ncbi:MAG: LemA family protein [Acidobacteriota bacterium]
MSNYEPGAATDQKDQFRQEYTHQQNQLQQQKSARSKWVIGSIVGVLLLLLILGVSAGGTYNGLNGKRVEVTRRFANIDTDLQRRADLIPNLVSTVKGYTKHEEAVFSEIAQARSRLINPQATTEQKIEANSQLDGALSRLLVITENYPDLKASDQFKNLQVQLEGTENRIRVSRQDYNTAVADYNASRSRFPSVIFASLFGFQPSEEFKADPGKRENPEVKF